MAGGNCPVCMRGESEEFLRLDAVPTLCNAAFGSEADALAAPRGDMSLCVCGQCGYVFNSTFEQQHVGYDAQYDNALHFSPRYQAYAHELASHLSSGFGPSRTHVVEVGCGDGYFLNLLCETAHATGTGYDPSCRRPQGEAPAGRVRFVADYFTGRHEGPAAELVCCRQVLEHVQQPQAFLAMLRPVLTAERGRRPALFVEVPNAALIREGSACWDILYEHVSYFDATSLAGLARRAGFTPLETWESYGRQFLCMLAIPTEDSISEAGIADQSVVLWKAFAGEFDRQRRLWQQRLGEWRQSGARVAFWGAGTKGTMLLNLLEDSRQLVDCVVDISPRKRGKYVAGTGHSIVQPADLQDRQPDRVVVMNPIYVGEVRQSLGDLRLTSAVDAVY